MWRLATNLEQINTEAKEELGNYILDQIERGGFTHFGGWAIGRLGGRVLLYGSYHHVVSQETARNWLSRLLRLKWKKVPGVAFSAAQIARRTGDRGRDLLELDQKLCNAVAARIKNEGYPVEWRQMILEITEVLDTERSLIFGESLPPGLKLMG